MRFSSAGMYGIGCYFSAEASYSDHTYAYTPPAEPVRQLLLAKILLGDSMNTMLI